MPRSEGPRPAEQAAGRYLAHLLRRPGPHRNIWVRMANDMDIKIAVRDPNEFSQEAVAAVYVEYLYEYKIDKLTSKEVARYRQSKHPKRLKHHKISRALQGNPL